MTAKLDMSDKDNYTLKVKAKYPACALMVQDDRHILVKPIIIEEEVDNNKLESIEACTDLKDFTSIKFPQVKLIEERVITLQQDMSKLTNKEQSNVAENDKVKNNKNKGQVKVRIKNGMKNK